MNDKLFDYSAAFSRNIGWLTPKEQASLRSKRVAIAGLGGVGGSHLLTLTRLGIASFTIADFDTFDLVNFNRQTGANLGTIGRRKTDVLAERAMEINPELDLKILHEGIHEDNVNEFLTNTDLYVDGLDFFAVSARRMVFKACTDLGIPAITAAPLGMGAALLNFLPGKMTFEEYFRLEGQAEPEQLLRFLLGLSPAMLQNRYLVERSTIDLANHRGPSTPMGCNLCAGVAATEALKILLGRGKVTAAPRGVHFDAYQNRLVRTWRPGGNSNPLQQFSLTVARKQLVSLQQSKTSTQGTTSAYNRPIEQILDKARWAPSGDNAQPWRFEIVDDNHVVVHGHDTRDHCIYDLRGRASQLAHGILLQTLQIAASEHGLRADFVRRQDAPETSPTIEVTLTKAKDIQANPLLPCITTRTVNRRRLSTRPLSPAEHSELANSLETGYRVIWIESFRDRLRFARLLFRNGGLRLHMPEAFETHRSIIQWNSNLSEDRIPDKAVGLDPMGRRLMHWAMDGGWSRVNFLNTYLGGSLIPRLELDFIPGIACAAHFLIIASKPTESIDDYINAGMAVQRFWLTAARLGLALQPEMTPLIFDAYVRDNIEFTRHQPSLRLAHALSTELSAIISPDSTTRAVFMGRVGAGPQPSARSVRRPLDDLIVSPQ